MRVFGVVLGGVATLFSVLFFVPSQALAASASGSSITTSPISRVLQASPGQSVSTTLSIMNNGLVPRIIQLQLETFKPYGTNGRAQITQPPANSPYISWAHFSENSFVLSPGIWQQVKLTITVPKSAALDYYYAVVVKPQVITSNPSGTNTNTLKGYNAILVLLDVLSPNAKAALTVKNFSASHGLYEYLPASFSVKTYNTGNVFMAPQGEIYISKSSRFANIIATIPFNASNGNVLPETTRIYNAQWTDGFPVFTPKTVDGQPVLDGAGQPVEHLVWNFADANKFRFGEYYAKLVLVYNNGTRDVPVIAVVSFWVIPYKLGSIVLIFVLLCLGGVYLLGRKVIDRTAKLSKKARKS